MKKFSILLLILFGSYAFTTAQESVTLTLPDMGAQIVGDVINIPLSLDAIDENIGTLQFYVEYDPLVLEPYGTSATGSSGGATNYYALLPAYAWYNVPQSPGDMLYTWLDFSGMGITVPAGIVMCELQFTYLGGYTDLTWGISKGVAGYPEKGQTLMWWVGTDFVTHEYIMNLNPGSVGSSGPLAFTWDGSEDDGSWVNLANWTPEPGNVSELDGADITIPVAGKATYPVITVPVTTGILNVATGAMLTVAPGGQLTTGGLFTNDGYFYITSDNVGGAGSFIDNGGLGGNGFYRFDRYMYNENDPGGSATPDNGWHLISSPVNNTVSGDFASYWLNEWDNDNNTYMGVDSYPGPTFCDGTSFGNVLVAGPTHEMKGYSIKRDLTYPTSTTPPNCPCWVPPLHEMPGFGLYPSMIPDVIAFGGDAYGLFVAPGTCSTEPDWFWVDNATNAALMPNVNNGNYTINAVWNGTVGNDIAGPWHEWNLLGNPYSSPIDCGTFTLAFPAGVNASISYWDDLGMTYQVWAAGVGVPQIPATQGFMVKVNTAGTHPVGVTTADRTHVGANVYYKSEIDDLLTLQASGNGYADKTYIRFLDEASQGFDRVWDANKLLSSAPGVPQIYTTAGTEAFAINSQPATTSVPMAFTSSTSGSYTIEAIETSNFPNVVLEDTYTGIQTNLLSDTYTFDFIKNDNANRFIVHFTPLGTPEMEANSIRIWSSERNIYVTVPATVTGDVVVYNMMGQEVVANKVIPGMNVIPVNDVNTYYVVKVRSNNNVVTEKVFIR